MRLSDTRFLVALLLPCLTFMGLGTMPAYALVFTLATWWGIALFDAVVPGGRSSPPAVADGSNLAFFTWVLRLFVPLQLALIGYGAYLAMTADWWVVVGVAYAVGFISGSQGITFAHELGHSKSKLDRLCAWVLMTSVCYGHFMVEHYRGHHPRAATFDDPASARYGESLYRFFPRTLVGSLASGWRLEAQRLTHMKQTWVQSPLLWSTLGSVAMCLTGLLMPFIAVASVEHAQAAIKVVAFLLLQSAFAFVLLETVNYIEHYGLSRNAEPGKKEAFGIMHAWNADHVATNSLLVNLQRHSDHHMHAWKPYATLQPLPGPQLPTGYAGCIILAMLPPVWFFVMHRRIASLQAKQPVQSGALA